MNGRLEHELHGLGGIRDFLGSVSDVADADYDWGFEVGDHCSREIRRCRLMCVFLREV